MTIPVICDRCRSSGLAGEGDFAHLGDLLEFEPVPRGRVRVDGWTAERQRAFIAALAVTGSLGRAAKVLGRSPNGIVKMRKEKGADSFNAAYDRALAIAAAQGTMTIASGLADAAARNAQLDPPPSRLRGHEPEDDDADMAHEEKLGLLNNIFLKLLRKVEAEREARLAGEVVAADFYLRQVTFIEVAFDMLSEGLGLDGWQMLGELRRDGHHITQIAETPMSRTLDDQRRKLWAAMAHPDRPEYPPEDYLVHHADHSREPLEYMRGGSDDEREAERARFAQRHNEEAEAQVAWEATGNSVHAQTTRTPTDSIEYLSSLESEEDIMAALMRDAESEDY